MITKDNSKEIHALVKELLSLLTSDEVPEEAKDEVWNRLSEDFSNTLVSFGPEERYSLLREMFPELTVGEISNISNE